MHMAMRRLKRNMFVLILMILLWTTVLSQERKRSKPLIKPRSVDLPLRQLYNHKVHPGLLPIVSAEMETKLHALIASLSSETPIKDLASITHFDDISKFASEFSAAYKSGKFNDTKAEEVYSIDSFKILGFYAKLHSTLHSLLYSRRDQNYNYLFLKYPEIARKMDEAVQLLEFTLYPFLRKPVLETRFRERGIVLTAGNSQMQYTLLLITSLRNEIKTALPIEILYNGPDDLSSENAALLSRFGNVTTINIQQIVNSSNVAGWSTKPFALFASTFRETIFIDSDVLMVRDPESLFNTPGYIETGTLFYHDRSISSPPRDPYGYLHKLLTFPSETAKATKMWMFEDSGHEMESGVLLIDKSRRALFPLLLAMRLNMQQEIGGLGEHFYGDKELFWISHELLEIPYYFNPSYAGMVGYGEGNEWICGPVAHSDEQKRLVWWNDGILKNKYFSLDETIDKFDIYSIDLSPNADMEYKFGTQPFCSKPKPGETFNVDEESKRLIARYIEIWRSIRSKDPAAFVDSVVN